MAMKPETTTKTRGAFLDRLTQVDEALKTTRQPIGARAVFLAIEKARTSWAAWSPAHRPQGRADLEAALAAEIQHARSDFLRLVDEMKALHLFDLNDSRNDPAEYYRLPRERAAAAALNALAHAAIQTRTVSDQLRRIRKGRAASHDRSQNAQYRASWGVIAAEGLNDLVTMIARRRRDWQRALVLAAEYRNATKEA
jgi:hypothetical protein